MADALTLTLAARPLRAGVSAMNHSAAIHDAIMSLAAHVAVATVVNIVIESEGKGDF
jgi:hypothetical protein